VAECRVHKWKRTGEVAFKYFWECSRCGRHRTQKNDDKRPDPGGCPAKGGPDPGMHHWGDAEKTKMFQDVCQVCKKERWREAS